MNNPSRYWSVRIWGGIVGSYALLLTYLLLTPHPLAPWGAEGAAIESVVDSTFGDLVEHAVAYALLASLLVVAFRTRFTLAVTVPIAWSLSSLHGSLCETFQALVPERTFAWSDLAANIIGAVAGSTIGGVISLGIQTFATNGSGLTASRVRRAES